MPTSPRASKASKRDDLTEFGPPRERAHVPEFSQPPIRIDDATGASIEDMSTGPASGQPVGVVPAPSEWAAAFGRFQDLAESSGLYPHNALALAQAFFDSEADGDAPARALVEAVIDVCEQETVLSKALRPQIIEAARARIGGKTPALRLSDFSHAGPVPAWVYDELPAPLAACCAPWGAGAPRDVFLTGALPVVSAALPWLKFKYGGVWQGCNQFGVVVAESGAGKRPLAVAGTLVDGINDWLEDESEREIERWELAQDDDELRKLVPRDCPPWRKLGFPGDTSDADFFLGMYANGGRRGRGGHGIIVESEIKILATSGGREWSDFRGKMLQGHAGERIGYGRKGQRTLWISDSEVSLALSGTPRSFREFIVDNEDGLFNRSAFYTFEAADDFENQWGDRGDDRLDVALDGARRLLLSGYRQLTARRDVDGRPVPLYLHFTDGQQERQYQAFRLQKAAIVALGYKPLATYTHRTGLLMLRIAGALTVLRRLSEGADLLHAKSFWVDERDFRVALQLAAVYTSHGVELARTHFKGVKERPVEDARRKGHRLFFDALVRRFGDVSFSRRMAVDLAPEVGVPVRSADRYLAQFLEAGLLSSDGAGLYYRTPLAPEPSAAEVRQMGDPAIPIGYLAPELLNPPGNGDPESDGGHGLPPPPPAPLGAPRLPGDEEPLPPEPDGEEPF